MDELPVELKVENKNNFGRIRTNHTLSLFRQLVYDFLISENENDFIDLSAFYKNHNVDSDDQTFIESTIMGELTSFGWKCETTYGGTALFIYSTKEPPPSCYPDGF